MRGWASDWADAWAGIRAHPSRSGLSLLAIAIGIAGLGVLLGVLSGLAERGRQLVRELGIHTFAVAQPGRPAVPGPDWKDLAMRHADVLARNLADCRVVPVRTSPALTAGAGRPILVVGAGLDLARVRNWTLHAGRFLDQVDLAGRSRVAVVSRAVADQQGLQVGGIMMIGRAPYQVVGIIDVALRWLAGEDAASAIGFDERLAVVPIQSVAVAGEAPGASKLDAIFVQVPGSDAVASRLRECRLLFDHPDMEASGLSWITPDALLSRIRSLQQMIRFTAGSLSVLCLLLGGTTMMSLMVANVRDRVQEIGLRRSLGARRQDIARLFMMEAGLLTVSAGLVGIIVANGLLAAAGAAFPLPTRVGLESTVLPMGAALLLGIAFSYGPARLAARISPSEALRDP
jgi:putative ABC transport system permease protein